MNETSEGIYKALLTAMPEGYVFHNMDGQIVDYNDAAYRLLRLTPDQLEGKTSFDPDWQLVHEDGRPFPGQHHPTSITLRTGEPCYDVIMGIENGADDTRWLKINSSLVKDPATQKTVGVLATFSDYTSQILFKKALTRGSADIDRRVGFAHVRLERLLMELTAPGNDLAGNAAILSQYAKEQALPDYLTHSIEHLSMASAALMQALNGVVKDHQQTNKDDTQLLAAAGGR